MNIGCLFIVIAWSSWDMTRKNWIQKRAVSSVTCNSSQIRSINRSYWLNKPYQIWCHLILLTVVETYFTTYGCYLHFSLTSMQQWAQRYRNTLLHVIGQKSRKFFNEIKFRQQNNMERKVVNALNLCFLDRFKTFDYRWIIEIYEGDEILFVPTSMFSITNKYSETVE